MLEQTGTVVEATDEWLWVEARRLSACSHCGAGSCSTSVVATLFGVKPNRFRLPNSLNAQRGQSVVIGIPDQVLVAVSLRAYMLPLLSMIGGVAIAKMLGTDDVTQAVFAATGLFVGLALVGLGGKSGKTQSRYAPQLLRKLGAHAIDIDSIDFTRNKT